MKTDTHPIPVSITDRLRALKVGKSVLLPFMDGVSARAIATRLKAEGRSFKSKRQGDQIRMWRIG